MATSTLDASACQQLRTRLEGLEGVLRAVVEEDEGIWLICETVAERTPTEVAARSVLEDEGYDPDAIPMRVAYLPESGPRRRIRFAGLESDVSDHGHCRVRVTLGWSDATYVGEAQGESAPAIQMRTAALATLYALEAILGDQADFRLIGVKPFRAFDTDLVVVSINRQGPPLQRLVGAALAKPDVLQGTALAVLHALNRVLGNLLSTTD